MFYDTNVPIEAAQRLRQAGQEIARALKPASPDEIETALMTLRATTRTTNETQIESELVMATLRTNLAHIPFDILMAAIGEFTRSPNGRDGRSAFFPRSPSEILSLASPPLLLRTKRADRLIRLADLAEAQEADRKRLAVIEPIPDAEVASWSASMRNTALSKGWITPQQAQLGGEGAGADIQKGNN